MTRVPVILISASTQRRGVEFRDQSISLSLQYALAIRAAGGVPTIVPPLPDRAFVSQAVQRADGVLLTGGDDIQPALYCRELPAAVRQTVSEPEPERDLFELELIQETFRQGKPLLAICRGQQILNVAFGGTLVTDIGKEMPDALDHRRTDRKDELVHDVELTPGTMLAKIVGKPKLGVNSSHHQAVGRLASLFRVTAVAPDGVVEALELTEGAKDALPYLLAVQFHPERLFVRHQEHLALFESFIRACGRDGVSNL